MTANALGVCHEHLFCKCELEKPAVNKSTKFPGTQKQLTPKEKNKINNRLPIFIKTYSTSKIN